MAVVPLLTVVLIIVFQGIMNKTYFYTGSAHNHWLKNIFWFSIFDYLMVFNNMLLGLAVVVARYITWLLVGLVTMGRMDVLMLPKNEWGVDILDAAFTSYVAVARQDHQYNSPVVNAFFQILQTQLHTNRRRRAKEKFVRALQEHRRAYMLTKGKSGRLRASTSPVTEGVDLEVAGLDLDLGGDSSEPLSRCAQLRNRLRSQMGATVQQLAKSKKRLQAKAASMRPKSKTVKVASAKPEPSANASSTRDAEQRAKLRARNRWQLWLFLLQNPRMRLERRRPWEADSKRQTAGDSAARPKRGGVLSCCPDAAVVVASIFTRGGGQETSGGVEAELTI